jgi:signal recognition particle subunit SRP54
MADMMKMMGGKGKGGMMKQMMGGLASKMGMGGLGGGMGGMPDLSKLDPKQLEALQKQAEAAGIKPGGMPGLGGGMPGGMPGLGGPKLPGLGGFPGLPGKKK